MSVPPPPPRRFFPQQAAGGDAPAASTTAANSPPPVPPGGPRSQPEAPYTAGSPPPVPAGGPRAPPPRVMAAAANFAANNIAANNGNGAAPAGGRVVPPPPTPPRPAAGGAAGAVPTPPSPDLPASSSSRTPPPVAPRLSGAGPPIPPGPPGGVGSGGTLGASGRKPPSLVPTAPTVTTAAEPDSSNTPASPAQSATSPPPVAARTAPPPPPIRPSATPSSPMNASSPVPVAPTMPSISENTSAPPAPVGGRPMPISTDRSSASSGNTGHQPSSPKTASAMEPLSSGGRVAGGSFSGDHPNNTIKRASVTHRASLSIGSNGVAMPVHKEVPTNEMQAICAHLETPEEIAQALLDSEGEYVEGLKVLLDTFCLRLRNHITLKRELLSEMEIAQLFSNVSSIKNFNSTLYHDLVGLLEQSPQVLLMNLGKTMIRFIPFFKLYTDYIKHHRDNARMLATKRAGSKDLEFFVQLNELSTGHKLQSLLTSPANRLAQYLVYLGAIYAKIDRSTEWALEYEQAVRQIQTVTDNIASFLKDQNARRLVVTVQVKLFENNIDVLSPSRTVAKYGKVKVISDNVFSNGHSTEKMVLVLMNDMVLYGEAATKLGKGKCKAVLQLPGMFAEDFGANQAAAKAYPDIPIDRCFRILTRSHKPLLFLCESAAAKQQWLDALAETIDKYASVMKRSIAPDQLQIACMTAEDFEKQVMKKKVDKKTLNSAIAQAQSMAQANKANPLPPSPEGSPRSQNRRVGAQSHSAHTDTSHRAAPERPAYSPASSAPEAPPRTGGPPPPPIMGSGPPAPPMSPSSGPPPALPTKRGGPPPPPVPGGAGVPAAPGPPPNAPPAPMFTSSPNAPPAPTFSPTATTTPAAKPASARNDLLSSIQSGGGLAGLKKVSALPPPSSSSASSPSHPASSLASPSSPLSPPAASGGGPVDLNAALKSSLDRYRQFVQDEEDDDMDEWDE